MTTGCRLSRSSEQQLADPGHAEDLLGDDRAGEDRRDPSAISVTTGIRLFRSDVTDHDDALGEALGSRGAHVVERKCSSI